MFISYIHPIHYNAVVSLSLDAYDMMARCACSLLDVESPLSAQGFEGDGGPGYCRAARGVEMLMNRGTESQSDAGTTAKAVSHQLSSINDVPLSL